MKSILLTSSATHFSQNDPTEVAEKDFELSAIPILAKLYPLCHVIPYKPIVYHESERWKPDLAIVEKQYNYWFVIEVEIAIHSLRKHILGQVRAFINGDYRQEAIHALAEGLNIPASKAATIVKYIPRYVAVVSNQENELWTETLTKENAQHISICSYANQDGSEQATLVNGRLQTSRHSLGFGTVDATTSCIRLPKNDFWQTGNYRIIEKTGIATWVCYVADHDVWLTKSKGTIQIPNQAYVQLIHEGDDIFLNELRF